MDLVVTPTPLAYFPGAALATGSFTSGYTVPGLRAEASGSICVRTACERYSGAQSYHDHNWGVWRGVTWEWGATRAGAYTLLYGRVQPPDSAASVPPFFRAIRKASAFVSASMADAKKKRSPLPPMRASTIHGFGRPSTFRTLGHWSRLREVFVVVLIRPELALNWH